MPGGGSVPTLRRNANFCLRWVGVGQRGAELFHALAHVRRNGLARPQHGKQLGNRAPARLARGLHGARSGSSCSEADQGECSPATQASGAKGVIEGVLIADSAVDVQNFQLRATRKTGLARVQGTKAAPQYGPRARGFGEDLFGRDGVSHVQIPAGCTCGVKCRRSRLEGAAGEAGPFFAGARCQSG